MAVTKAELIKMLQESEAPDTAYVDVSIGSCDCRGPGDKYLSREEPYWTHIANGPNRGDWLTFDVDD